jgi:DNA-binding winged helix-turn-helix (wHTH) protein
VILRFGAFELDCERFELCRDGALLDLQPRVLGVIEYLVRNRERLVTRAELQAAVWRGVHVEEDSLYRAVAIARRVLHTGSGAADPIRTQRGRGYRFVAPVVAAERVARARALPALPGRAGALAALEAALDRARTGHRELVAIRGEAGIGKTRLIETFAADLRRGSDAELAIGRCAEPLAGAEPYSPLLEAIGRLARRAGSDALDVIASRAPSWLAQLPALGGEPRPQRRAPTREQLVEELADALETLAAQRPLVLVLEDLHWSDYATLGLLSSLAQRTEPAALLIVATIRSGEPAAPGDPLGKLIAELVGKRLCSELVLAPLDAEGVRQVLESRAGAVAPEMVQWLAERSGGNPLFLHHLIDFAETGEASAASRDVPARLADLLWHRTASLGDDTVELLGAASAAGVEFCAAEVAAALGADALEVAERCEDLAQREIHLARAGVAEWPDGTLTERFRFRHVLQREALYARTAPARRRVHHRRIAERLESAWGERSREIATALAAHWDAAGDAAAALPAYRLAIEGAARCRAGHDARALAERAFALLDRREEAARAADELAIRFALAPALPVALGYADPAVEANLLRAQELCDRVGDGERRLAVLWSRSYARYQAGEPEASLALARELLDAARALGRPAFEMLAHDAMAFSHHKTCRFEASERHCEQVLALYDPERHAELCDWVGQDVAVDAAVASAFNLWNLGRPGAARRRIEEAVAFARRSQHAYSLVFALCYAAAFHLTAEDRERATACAEEASALARAERLAMYRGFAELMRAAALPREGGRLSAMLHALRGLRLPDQADETRTSGTTAVRALFVAAFADEGLRDMARAQLAEAFSAVDASGEHHQLPGLHLLRALLAQDEAEVEREIARALAIACERGLGMGALQATLELARLRIRQGRDREARSLLAEQLPRFADEPDVPLLARARSLAAELGAPA